MTKLNLVAIYTLLTLGTALMQGQSTQFMETWVSAFGFDTNPCSRIAPCKTFAGALAQTLPGGEIDVLDPANFGPVTITKSVTIDGGSQIATVLVNSGNAIVVQAGASDVVFLRHLRLNGLLGNGSNSGNAGVNGIRFISGKYLSIENCDISGFNNNGIDLENNQNSSVQVKNTTSSNNGSKGLFATTSSGTIKVSVDSSYFSANAIGGVWADANSQVTVSNSVAYGNSVGFIAQGNGGGATINITRSVSINNGVGIQAGGGANPATLSADTTFIAGNTAGIVNGINGATHTFGSGTNPTNNAQSSTFTGAPNPIQ